MVKDNTHHRYKKYYTTEFTSGSEECWMRVSEPQACITQRLEVCYYALTGLVKGSTSISGAITEDETSSKSSKDTLAPLVALIA